MIEDRIWQDKTVLITGGFGYVGGRISRYLKDNTNIKIRIGTHRENIKHPEWLRKEITVHIDLLSSDSLQKACEGVDAIIHLAAINEIDSALDPEKAITINSTGTLRLLQAAEKNEVKKFIYFSTAHVYKAPLSGEISEMTIPRPVHPYAISHKTAEDFVLSFHDKKILTGIVLRLSNSFGVPADAGIDRWSLLVNNLCKQIAEKGKIILKSSGVQKRDFITLTDVCRAVFHLLSLDRLQYSDGIFNLGGENTIRVIEMAELVATRCEKQFGFRPQIIKPAVEFKEEVDLIYKIDKLKATGFVLIGNTNYEIDETLKFCKRAFGA